MAKDFSRPVGPRLRIALAKYEPRNRRFRAVKDAAALVNVADAGEQRRLWSLIEGVIEGEEWRNGRTDSASAPVAGAPAAV